MIRESRYLKLIVGLLTLSAVVTLIIDFQFKFIVQESFQSKDQLTAFFGSFYAWVGISSFFLQIIAGRWIVEKYGIRITLLALPIALLSGTCVLLAYPLRLWAGLLMKGSDGALRYSIDKSTIELLYVPIPENVKAEVKAVIDMVIQRIADGAGGILLLLMTRVLNLGIPGTAMVNIGFLCIWIWVAYRARQEHVLFLRTNLSGRRIMPETALRAAFLNKASTDEIRAMMEGDDEESVLYAMELAVAIGRTDLIPASLAEHRSGAVRSKAIDLVSLTENEYLKRLNEETESEVLAKVMFRGCSVVGPAGSLSSPEDHLQAEDIRIRLAAVSCLAHGTPADNTGKVREYLDTAIGRLKESSEEWNYVAEAIGEIHHPAAIELHKKLMHHPNRTVRKKAILSAGRSGQRELVSTLVRLLASPDVSSTARVALREFHDRILGTLSDVLLDSRDTIEIRRQIPLILAQIPSQQTVDALIRALSDEDGILRFRSLRALNRLRIAGHDFQFNIDAVSRHIEAESEKVLWYEYARGTLYPQKENRDLLAQLLKEKSEQGRERVFRLLGLILPPSAAHASYNAIVEEGKSRKANAVEYLDSALPAQLKKWVLPLIEARELTFEDTVSTIIEKFLKSRDWVLQECAKDAVKKNQWPEAAVNPSELTSQ
jgi:HEAT repeat protein